MLEVKSDPVGIPNGDLFLLSDQNLDSKKYNDKFASITWEYSTIRSWLNGDFINSAFSSNEQMAIKTTNLKNDDNPEYGTMGGNDTEDRIFLLSIDEAKNENYGFTNNYSDTTTREAKRIMRKNREQGQIAPVTASGGFVLPATTLILPQS